MKFVPAPKEAAIEFDTIGSKARQLLVGNLFTQDFLNDVQSSLLKYRQEHPSSR
jgi:DNA-dependent RNA polymerase auxiliary subunit epsilon